MQRDRTKPYMLLCTLQCPVTTSFFYLRSFRKILGRWNVISCGPGKTDISWDFKRYDQPIYSHDVEMPEKPHPHTYSYTEIFDKCREKGIDVDFDYIFIAEPNFSPIVGIDGFRPKCHVSYFQCDDHRGPRTALKNMMLGQCDSYIHPNKYYEEIFEYPHIIDGIKYIPEGKKFILSKSCYEPGVHEIYKDAPDFEKYDVVFLGNTGIEIKHGRPEENFQMTYKYADYHWKDDRGNTYKSENNIPLFNKGCPQDHKFFEYADRSELLCRLKSDFPRNFKILPTVAHPIEYAKILNQGKIVINMSIAQDLNMRVGEVIGCGRVLITDECEGMDSVCGVNNITHIRYRKYYHPMNINWDLTYDIIKSKIQYLLANRNKIKEIQENAYQWIRHSGNSYLDRCRMILQQTIGWEE